MTTPKKRPESLETVLRRVVRDATDVNAPVTPRMLALAVGVAGWKHPTAKLTDSRNEEETES